MITLDSIIIGLQKYGGISNYWQTLSSVVSKNFSDTEFLLPKTQQSKTRCLGSGVTRIEQLPTIVSRYCDYSVSPTTEIAHSSYYRLPRTKSVASIVTCYDFTYERYRSDFSAIAHKIQKKRALMSCDHIIAISENTKKDILEFIPKISESKISVVHIPIAENDFNENLGFTYDNRVVFSGARSSYKRFDLAVEAVSLKANLTLDIIGPPLTPLEHEFVKARLGNRFTQFEAKSNDEVLKRISGCYAFLFPSDYEGFGLPILEAFQVGAPVICANRSSFPELVGSAGFLVDQQISQNYRDCLNELENTETRNRLVSHGYKRLNLFTLDQFTTKMAEVYEHL